MRTVELEPAQQLRPIQARPIQDRQALWDGNALICGSGWLFRGTITRAVQVCAPATQVVIARMPLLPGMVSPAVVQAGAPAGPPFAPLEVTVLVLDAATLAARHLRALPLDGLVQHMSAAAFDTLALQCLVQRSFAPLLHGLAQTLHWPQTPAQLIQRTSTHPRMGKLMQLLDRGEQVRSVAHAAKLCNLSLRWFNEAFKHDIGLNCVDYLAFQKMLLLLNQLSTPGTTVTQAANDVGFADLSHATRSLRRFLDARASDLYGLRAVPAKHL